MNERDVELEEMERLRASAAMWQGRAVYRAKRIAELEGLLGATDFKPNWTLSQKAALAVTLTISLSRHIPDWPGCTDEQLGLVAEDILKERVAGFIADALAEAKAVSETAEIQRQLGPLED